jgi:hypothetical protein
MQRAGLVISVLAIALSPVGAGATGHGPLAMLAFAGVFFLANAVIRPGSVSLAEPGALVAQGLTSAAFSAVLVSLGQTIRALGRIETEIGLEGWLVLAAWGIVLGRLIWRRSMGERAMKGAEKALRVVHRSGQPPAAKTGTPPAKAPKLTVLTPDAPPARAPDPKPPRRPVAAAPDDPALREALERLNALPEAGADEAALSRTLATLSGAAPLGAVFAALTARADAAGGTERDRRALARHATDPWVAERRAGKGEPAQAFEIVVAAADAVALAEFTTRALALVDEIPEARHDMPEIPRLLEIADQIEDTLETEAELLVALAHKLEDLALEAEQGGDV